MIVNIAEFNSFILKDLIISTPSTSSGIKKVEKPAAKVLVKTEAPKKVLTEAEKKKAAELSCKQLKKTAENKAEKVSDEANEKAKQDIQDYCLNFFDDSIITADGFELNAGQ